MEETENTITKFVRRWSHTLLALAMALWCMGCGGGGIFSPEPPPATPGRGLARMGYSIQAGAFANLDNAVRLAETLESQGMNAYYYLHHTGLYKVRFGDFPSRESARRKAETIQAAGIIQEYYIVRPEDYAAMKYRKYGDSYLRNEIVKTAKRLIGVPYRWGGSSPDGGFDCSGLTMTVYRLNGLNLPRSSREQYRAGTPVAQSQLLQGDLVFFATSGGRQISHVGIYAGDGEFIHAPKRGRRIRKESLSNSYFRARYAGARTYLN